MTAGPAAGPAALPMWVLPRRLLLPSALIGVTLFLPLVAAWLVGGAGAALLVGLAYGAAVPLAVGLPIRLIGYALAGNYTLQVACLTPMIILLGSAGGAVAQLATERVLATVAGALVAGAVGALVLWLEQRVGVRAPTEPVLSDGTSVAG